MATIRVPPKPVRIATARGLFQHLSDEGVERRCVASDVGLKLQLAARNHDGRAVVADGAAQYDTVADLRARGGELYGRLDNTNPRGIDENPIGASVAVLQEFLYSGADTRRH